MKSLIAFLLFVIASSQSLAWDIYECEKNLLMSSMIGIGVQQRVDGNYFFGYEDGQPLFQWRVWNKTFDDLFKEKTKPDWKYPNVVKADGLISAFMRQDGYPDDFHSVLLDVVNGVFFVTVKQVDLKYTTSGNCKAIILDDQPV
tara:strand:+ start:37 stop:468 length:432 start_codon:yes stop_codon:yes gene_type:complete